MRRLRKLRWPARKVFGVAIGQARDSPVKIVSIARAQHRDSNTFANRQVPRHSLLHFITWLMLLSSTEGAQSKGV